jgi:hypothetical protein
MPADSDLTIGQAADAVCSGGAAVRLIEISTKCRGLPVLPLAGPEEALGGERPLRGGR